MNKHLNLQLTAALISSIVATNNFAATTRPADEQQLARDIYKQYVEIQSGFSTGTTTPVVDVTVKRLKAAGFADEDIFVGGPIPTKANLVVRYRGTGEKKPILLLAHTDVVEAKPSDWSMNPFKFTEKDGYFYGRGTTDDKAEAAIWIANLIQYKREGYKPNRDIIVALTADEEGVSPYNGVVWLLKNDKSLINADFALNEGGWGDLNKGVKRSNNLQVSEKYIINFRLTVTNKGGHSSLPTNDNAIYHLANALTKISTLYFPLKTNAVTNAYFKQLAKTENGSEKEDIIKTTKNDKAAMKRLAASSPQMNATLHTTCVATMLEGGHALNALPQLATATINCRVLPDETPESIEKAINTVIADPKVKVERMNELSRSPESPLRSDLIEAVTEATNQSWPSVPMIPVMVMGATDGRFLRAEGIPTYGVSGLFYDRDDLRAHGRDERMRVESFYEGQAFLYNLVKRLSSDDKKSA